VSAARRFLPSDPKDFLRSIVPLALLAIGAILPDSPFIVLALVVLGTVIAAMRDAPVRWAWGGAIPVAVLLVIGPGVVLEWAGRVCTDLTGKLDDRELIRAVTVILVVLGVAIPLKADAASLWLRWPARSLRVWIPVAFVGAFAVGAPVGILLGTAIPGGDGTFALTLQPAALVPALVFGVTRSIVDELAFRGALLGWTARVLGTGPAILGQAVIYALAYPAFGGTPSAMVLVGVAAGVAGVITVRTRSLAIPLAANAGLSIAVYLVPPAPPERWAA
jgi:membrane protease YdiL (CAAX protease family)